MSFSSAISSKVFRGNPNYFWMLQASSFSSMGIWLFRLTVAYLIWDLTKSGYWVSACALADALPRLLFSPLAGALADRIHLRRASYIICSTLALVHISMIFLYLLSEAATRPYILILWWTMIATISSLSNPVHQKLLSYAFTKENIKRALSISSICFNVSRASAPLLLGLAVKLDVVELCLLGIMISPLVVALSTYRFAYHKGFEVSAEAKAKSLGRDVLDAWQYIWSHPDMFLIFSTIFFSTILARSIYDVLPMITEYLLLRPTKDFTYIALSLGLSALAAGLFGAVAHQHLGAREIALLTVAAVVCIMVNVFFNDFYVAIILLGLSSFVFVLSGLSTVTYIHQHTPEHYKGKVLSLYFLLLFVCSSIGAILFSVLYELNLGRVIWLLPLSALPAIVFSYRGSQRRAAAQV